MRNACARRHLAPVWAALILLALGAVAPTQGNVIPEAVILVHVQPFEWSGPGMGPPPDITTCDEIQQYSDQLGPMEFALFLYPIAISWEGLSVHSLEASLSWPDSWIPDRWQPCNQGHGTLAEQGSGATLSLSWSPPRPMSSEVFLFARFVLEAPEAGAFDFPQEVVVSADAGLQPFNVYAFGAPGQAGMLCGDCGFPCNGSTYCTPVFSAPGIELVLPPDSSTQVSLPFMAAGSSPQVPCTLLGEASEPWMQVEITPLAWPEYRLDVDISTAGMLQGTYDGWVLVTSRCTACASVLLMVRDAADITYDEPVRETSWGRLKNTFR